MLFIVILISIVLISCHYPYISNGPIIITLNIGDKWVMTACNGLFEIPILTAIYLCVLERSTLLVCWFSACVNWQCVTSLPTNYGVLLCFIRLRYLVRVHINIESIGKPGSPSISIIIATPKCRAPFRESIPVKYRVNEMNDNANVYLADYFFHLSGSALAAWWHYIWMKQNYMKF